MTEKKLKISVCIVSYNHGRYIDDCLASVIAQHVDAELEVLVGDDCSSDNTRNIIASYAARYPELIFPVFHEKNIGGSQNYRSLIERAQGDYIAHLDGDDYWLPGKLSAQILFIIAHPKCVAVYCNAIVINDTGQLRARFNRHIPDEIDLNFLIKGGNFLNASSLMYRSECKNLLLSLKGETLDYLSHVQFAGQGRLGYVNRDLVVYRIHSATSVTRTMPELLMTKYWDAIVRGRELGADDNALRQCISGYFRSLLRTAIIRRRPRAAFLQYKKIAAECPLASKPLLLRSLMTLPFYLWRDLMRGLARRIFKGGVEILYDR